MINQWFGRQKALPWTNSDAEDAPPFACVGVVSLGIEEGELVVTGRQPLAADVAGSKIVINDETEVPANSGGLIICDFVTHALFLDSDSPSIGDEIGPLSGEWHMGPAGSGFVFLGSDSDSYSVGGKTSCLVRYVGGSGGDVFSFTLKSSRTAGTPSSWTADIIDPTDESTVMHQDQTIYGNHQMFDDLESGDKGVCGQFGSDFIILNAPCGD